MKRKWIAFVACAALVGTMALAAGCSNDPVEGQGVSGQSNAAVLSGTLNLNGSTSMAEISNALGERFMEKNPRRDRHSGRQRIRRGTYLCLCRHGADRPSFP